MRTNRKRVVSISLVLMLVLLCLGTLAPSSSAGFIGDVPVKPIRIDAVIWDRDAAEFIVKLSCPFGIATAGEHADFMISTNLKIDTGGSVISIDPKETGIRKEAGAVKDADKFIKLEPQRIPWDRDGGRVNGIVTLTFSFVLLNPGGGNSGGMTEINPPSLELNVDPPDPD